MKKPLFYVHITYNKDGKSWANQEWIRAKDSFKALKIMMDSLSIVPNQVWSQHVITRDDFLEKENEVE